MDLNTSWMSLKRDVLVSAAQPMFWPGLMKCSEDNISDLCQNKTPWPSLLPMQARASVHVNLQTVNDPASAQWLSLGAFAVPAKRFRTIALPPLGFLLSEQIWTPNPIYAWEFTTHRQVWNMDSKEETQWDSRWGIWYTTRQVIKQKGQITPQLGTHSRHLYLQGELSS